MIEKRSVVSFLIPLLVFSLSCNSSSQFLFGTLTPTVTITPSQTATPTATITPSKTPQPDYSKAILLLEDLPSGFEDISDAFPADQQGYKSLGNYAYGNSRIGQIIVGNTVLLNGSADKFSFKMFANNPELIAKTIIGEAENVTINDTFVMEHIGESCVGFRGEMKVEGVVFNIEFAILQRGNLGAFVANFYIPPNRPALKIEDLMEILDGHFMEIFPAEATT